MKNKLSVQQQVEQLTAQQQDQIVKIGKVVTIIDAVVIALVLLWAVMGMSVAANPPMGMELEPIELALGIFGGGMIGFLFVLAVSVFVMVKYPYYSDKKLSYIRKMRKQG